MRRSPDAIRRWNNAVKRARNVAQTHTLPNGEQILLENIFRLDEAVREDLAPGAACPFLGQEAWVSAEGRFNPCCAPDAQRLTLGEFGNLNTQGFAEIWNGKAYESLTATYGNRDLCLKCNMRKPVEAELRCGNTQEFPLTGHITSATISHSMANASMRCWNFRSQGLLRLLEANWLGILMIDGTPAYERRFERTFGFYENIAAVMNLGDWHHIRIDGSELYDIRYDWCGNFQDLRCTVRTTENKYFHIRPDGTPAYLERWRYAGDFRDGVAVVQNSDGHSTHIDRSGREINSVCFVDLDVYHKGFARARDHDGWMHIDLAGNPLYERRFAAVEPFYNGQARVEDFFGRIEVIDESGNSLVELHPATTSNFSELSDDLVGFWRTQTIRAAVKLGCD